MFDNALDRHNYRAARMKARHMKEEGERTKAWYDSIDWAAYDKATKDKEEYLKEHHAEIAHDILYGVKVS